MITAVSIMGIIAVAVTSFMIVSYYLNRLKQARARARAKARARAMSKFRAIKAFSSIGGARGLAFAVPKGSGGGVAGALGELKALQVSEPQLADEETKVVPFEKKLPKPDYLANFDPAAAAAARLAEAQKAVEETERRQRSKRDLAEQRGNSFRSFRGCYQYGSRTRQAATLPAPPRRKLRQMPGQSFRPNELPGQNGLDQDLKVDKLPSLTHSIRLLASCPATMYPV